MNVGRKPEDRERKIEFEWVVDEWVAKEYILIGGAYRLFNRTPITLDDIIRIV